MAVRQNWRSEGTRSRRIHRMASTARATIPAWTTTMESGSTPWPSAARTPTPARPQPRADSPRAIMISRRSIHPRYGFSVLAPLAGSGRAGRRCRPVRCRHGHHLGAAGAVRVGDRSPAGAATPLATPSVDEVGVTERVASLATRSIKKDSKMDALTLAVRMMDLTTLEGKDTPGKVAQMSSKAIRPDPVDPSVPSVAAVCVYPAMVPYALEAVAGSGVKVASVRPTSPPARSTPSQGGRDVVGRGAGGRRGRHGHRSRSVPVWLLFQGVRRDRRVKEACGDRAHLKVILETGELGGLDDVRRASMLAMAAGADFIKTSTGKVQPAATLPVTLVMLEAIRDFYGATGVQVGMKPAGGIRTAKDAIRYLVVLNETLGSAWMTPDWFRFGASTLLNDVLMQIRWLKTGRYQSADYFTKD